MRARWDGSVYVSVIFVRLALTAFVSAAGLIACSSSGPSHTGTATGTGGTGGLGGAGSRDAAADAAGGTAAGSGAAGTGAAGTGAAGSAAAGTTGAAGTRGAAGTTGAAGTGAAGKGAAGSGGGGGTGSAGQGAAGAAGTGAAGTGAAGTGAAGSVAAIDTVQSVLTRNKHETRDGFFVQPTITRAMAARMAPDAGFNGTFAGPMWASPLYVSNGPGGKGIFIAASNNNVVYALNETTGAIVWMHSIGPAPEQTGVPCGTMHPIGIISTPVIDPTTRTLYAAGAIGPGEIQRHEIHALSVDDGSPRPGWPVNVSAMQGPGGLPFPTKAQNQRPALSLVNGILYVAYGGHGGDCANYHGWVIAVNTKTPTTTGAWASAGLGEAIWASGGMASDGNGVIAITGNRNEDSPTHQDSEEVVRVTGMGSVNRATGIFFPSTWRTMDQQDADFGANSPVVFTLPGATPSSLVAAIAKDGHFYLLDAANFGGSTPLQDLMVANGGAMAVRSAPAAYPAAGGGVRVVFNTQGGASCGRGIVSVLVSGATPTATLTWCAKTDGDSSPIATSTNGKDDVVVWYMDGTRLRAVDGQTGDTIRTSDPGECGNIQKWTSPIAAKGRIIVGGDGHLCAWSPQ